MTSTRPSGKLRAQPVRPRFLASSWVPARYQTPCTLPDTKQCIHIFSVIQLTPLCYHMLNENTAISTSSLLALLVWIRNSASNHDAALSRPVAHRTGDRSIDLSFSQQI